jgi:hypothetical protein
VFTLLLLLLFRGKEVRWRLVEGCFGCLLRRGVGDGDPTFGLDGSGKNCWFDCLYGDCGVSLELVDLSIIGLSE